MSLLEHQKSTDEWMLDLGAQFRTLRIRAGLDQQTLAERANSSVGAIKNLENGKGSSVKTMVRVTRALDQTHWLELLAPIASISPLQMLTAQRLAQPRMKVYRARSAKPKKEA